MKGRDIIAAFLSGVLSVSCTSFEVRDHSFEVIATAGYDAVSGQHQVVLSLGKGDPEEQYSIRYEVDSEPRQCLSYRGAPIPQDGTFRFDEKGKAVFGISDLEKGSHSLLLEVKNSHFKQSVGLPLSITPAPFTVEAKVLTENLLVSVLDIQFTSEDSRETYRATAMIDGRTVMKDSVLTLPHFSIPLGAVLPGERTLHLTVSDSYSTHAEDIAFREPGRERFMDLVLGCERNTYGQPTSYRMTAKDSPLPYSVDLSVEFLIRASATVGYQDNEGERPHDKTFTKHFKELYIGTLSFDGTEKELLDVQPVRQKIESCTEPSIVSWYWDGNNHYLPKETVDEPYRIQEIIPDMELRHAGTPGVKIRMTSTVGPVRINGVTHTEKEIII